MATPGGRGGDRGSSADTQGMVSLCAVWATVSLTRISSPRQTKKHRPLDVEGVLWETAGEAGSEAQGRSGPSCEARGAQRTEMHGHQVRAPASHGP